MGEKHHNRWLNYLSVQSEKMLKYDKPQLLVELLVMDLPYEIKSIV